MNVLGSVAMYAGAEGRGGERGGRQQALPLLPTHALNIYFYPQ